MCKKDINVDSENVMLPASGEALRVDSKYV